MNDDLPPSPTNGAFADDPPPAAPDATADAALELVLITGMSGSGKSVALNALEDAGYYCVDNLPPELLAPFVALQRQQDARQVAVAMDVRSGVSLPLVPQQLDVLRREGLVLRSLFLEATTEALVRRYSESRRRHPLSREDRRTEGADQQRLLIHAIDLERELLADLRDGADVIDTSIIRPAQLQSYVKALISAPQSALTLVFGHGNERLAWPTEPAVGPSRFDEEEAQHVPSCQLGHERVHRRNVAGRLKCGVLPPHLPDNRLVVGRIGKLEVQ